MAVAGVETAKHLAKDIYNDAAQAAQEQGLSVEHLTEAAEQIAGKLKTVAANALESQNPDGDDASSSTFSPTGEGSDNMSETRYGDSPGFRSQATTDAAGGSASVRQQAGELAKGLQNQAASVAQDLSRVKSKEQASLLTEKAKEAAAGAGNKLRNAAEDQKNVGADFVSGVASAVRRAAGEFDNQIPFAGDYIRRAAEQIDGASDALRQRDLGELINGVQDFARRQPTAFLGMTVLAGFAAVRFLKSSTSSRTDGSPSAIGEDQLYHSRVANSETARRLQGAGSGMPQERRI